MVAISIFLLSTCRLEQENATTESPVPGSSDYFESGADEYHLSEGEVTRLEKLANSGDWQALGALIDFYLMADGTTGLNREKAVHWLRIGVDRGEDTYLYDLVTVLNISDEPCPMTLSYYDRLYSIDKEAAETRATGRVGTCLKARAANS